MARPLRIEYPNAVYHVTSRGNARQIIFSNDNDYLNFLKILEKVIKRYNWILHAYSLMGNHYHLLVETPEGNLSKGMRQLNGVYTQFYNRAHDNVGHLLQGRYHAILIEKDNYLLEVSRYLVLNPVRAGLVTDPGLWPWSSYNQTAGEFKKQTFLTTHELLSLFNENKELAVNLYKEFVKEGIDKKSPWEGLKGGIHLGGDSFVETLKECISNKGDLKEIPKIQRCLKQPSLEDLFQSTDKGKKEDFHRTIYEAHFDWHYSLKDLALFLKVHYSTISRIVKRCEDKKGE